MLKEVDKFCKDDDGVERGPQTGEMKAPTELQLLAQVGLPYQH